MEYRTEIKELLQSKELMELWQTIQQDLPQLRFKKKQETEEEEEKFEEARIDYIERDILLEYNTIFCKYDYQELSIKKTISIYFIGKFQVLL